MLRCIWLVFFCALLLLFCGCRTSEVTCYPAYEGQPTYDGHKVLANVQGVNYGFFLFGFIPLWCGDPKMPNSRHYVTLHNRLKPEYSEIMMEGFVRRRFGTGKLVACRHTEQFSGLYTLFIVWRKVINSRALWISNEPAGK